MHYSHLKVLLISGAKTLAWKYCGSHRDERGSEFASWTSISNYAQTLQVTSNKFFEKKSCMFVITGIACSLHKQPIKQERSLRRECHLFLQDWGSTAQHFGSQNMCEVENMIQDNFILNCRYVKRHFCSQNYLTDINALGTIWMEHYPPINTKSKNCTK